MDSQCYTDRDACVACLSDDLCRLLEKSILLAKTGDWAGVDRVSTQMNAMVMGLAETRRTGSVLSQTHQIRLRQLYGQLMVALQAEQKNVQGDLRQLREVKRAVGIYSTQMGKH